MCNGPRNASSPPMAGSSSSSSPKKTPSPISLLDLSASDDLPSFLLAIEQGAHSPNTPAPWYSRLLGSNLMSLEHRTPLHIAALYGSTNVLHYLISTNPGDVNLPSGSDAATPLHLAAGGGPASSPLAVNLLLAAGADVDALDAAGRRPADVIPRHVSLPFTRSLEVLLKATSPTKEVELKKEKEYPLDLTLPDIKTGIYGTDEFRMYTFKVKPCSRAYSHDWTECPFVHPGENARRRDPMKFVYSCVPCPEFRKGACRNGDNCEYAHGVFECWLHPSQYRTRLCKDETGCNRRVCFFAHKVEELRSVNPMGLPSSPRSVNPMGLPSSPRSPSLSSLDMAAALMMMLPGSPMSPSSSSEMGSMQLPSSRLKSSLTARDIDFDLELMGLEGYQQKLNSPRSNLRVNTLAAAAAASRASEYSELLGSMDPSMISQLQGLQLKQTSTIAAQYQSSAGMLRNQSMNQQMYSGYGGNLPASSAMSASSSLGLDHSTAKAIMNSRATAFAKRSHSFIDRGAVGRNSSLAGVTAAAPIATVAAGQSWGTSSGKLDWGIEGEELNKLRKSASFAMRSNSNAASFGRSGGSPPGFNEPDLSWVHSLVKDGPTAGPVGQPQMKRYPSNIGREFIATDMLSPWAEQEQMVAG